METDRGVNISCYALLFDCNCHDALAGCAVAVAVLHRHFFVPLFWYDWN